MCMKKIIPIIIAAAVLFGCIFAAGCVEEQTSVPEQISTEEPDPLEELEIGEPAYTITVTTTGNDTYSTGEIFALQFKSNPSTGYRWIVTEGNEILCNNFTIPAEQKGDKLMAGAPGKQEFWFQPEKAGDYKITVKYMRSWEGEDSAVSTYSQTLHVVDSDEPSVDGVKTMYAFDSFNINPKAGEYVKIIKAGNLYPDYWSVFALLESDISTIETYKDTNPELDVPSGQYEWYVTSEKAGEQIFRVINRVSGSDEEISYFDVPLKFV